MTAKKSTRPELRIDMTDSDGRKFYAEYSRFHVSNVFGSYKLKTLGVYKGNAGN